MISPWTIYWIMQLDSIRGFFGALQAAGFVGLFIAFVTVPLWIDGTFGVPRKLRVVALSVTAALLVFGGLGRALLPTSKTAAAMVLIPAIANNETVQKEAGELYQLAKDGLRELVKPEKENSK